MIVTVEADATPPRIRIDTTAGATVNRVQDGAVTPVRGTVDESGTLYDYECPQEAPVSYDDGLVLSELVELPNVGDWLVHLAAPDLSQLVTLGRNDEWTSPANVSVASIPGGPTIAVSMTRASDQGALTLNTYTRDEELALRALLEDGSTLFLSTHAQVGLGPGYFSLGEARWRRRINFIGDDARYCSLPYVQTARPVYVPAQTLTWEELPSTWGALAPTWDTLERA